MTIHPGFGSDRRLAGIGATLLVHLALIAGWQMARQAPPAQSGGREPAIQWLQLPAPATAPRIAPAPAAQEPAPATRRAPARSSTPGTGSSSAVAPVAPTPGVAFEAQSSTDPGPAPSAPAQPSVESILQEARRSAGDIERALRKERQPTIVAPPDSAEIRMRQRMQEARELAPPRTWEAPKIEELVNQTGDGARRTRVITGRGTYCITERSPVTSIDMIEKHGKQRFTNCPQHETPARPQEWRTARD